MYWTSFHSSSCTANTPTPSPFTCPHLTPPLSAHPPVHTSPLLSQPIHLSTPHPSSLSPFTCPNSLQVHSIRTPHCSLPSSKHHFNLHIWQFSEHQSKRPHPHCCYLHDIWRVSFSFSSSHQRPGETEPLGQGTTPLCGQAHSINQRTKTTGWTQGGCFAQWNCCQRGRRNRVATVLPPVAGVLVICCMWLNAIQNTYDHAALSFSFSFSVANWISICNASF